MQSDLELGKSNPCVSATPWLVCLVLLVAVAVFVVAFVPMAECPDESSFVRGLEDMNRSNSLPPDPNRACEIALILHDSVNCQICKGTGKVSLLKKWTRRTADQA